MNEIDIILLIPILWFAYKGFKKGLIQEAASFVALLAGVWGATEFSEKMIPHVQKWFNVSADYAPIIAFGITFLVIVFTIILLGRIIEKSVKMVGLGIANRLTGAGFGVLKALFIIGILTLVLNAAEKYTDIVPESTKEDSLLYEPVNVVSGHVFMWVTQNGNKVYKAVGNTADEIKEDIKNEVDN